ncbi:hypothetical protein Pmar_PMAR022310 [Perkinsus marinus ATCC 50983]|uniref:Uncharacterized protein n=1 Tax=Perkinsus marinus (strain ATCC 50983 / TXsc) TaxID=423536 RepID=C5KDR2_PERM5|nr:hypothetical protein Pmar_PMAR022310 [Perkinsus marinus ATCC 50983]EER17365.1 hypothetical protein Pmar_PMAR022310 [Perkinsus marinus ATCC 50983]|eukprot:XP_002785569.1 hypothetical protein Pmar_PMAR022310 [Perkinsus marinus ATCC 50983]
MNIHAAVNADHIDVYEDDAMREMFHEVDSMEDGGVHGLNKSAQNLLNEGARRCGTRYASSENLVKLWENDQSRKRGRRLLLPSGEVSPRVPGRRGSASLMVRVQSWFSDSAGDDGEEETSEEKAVRVRALQRAEISSWFSGAPVEALKRGNVKIWMAEYFFEGYEVDQLTPSEQEEMEVVGDACDVMDIF